MTKPTRNGSAVSELSEFNPKVDQILAGARRVFLEHGFAAATTDIVQQAAGVSKSTMYAYFPNKEVLFSAVVRVECEKMLAQTRTEVVRGRTIQETLRRIGIRLLEAVLEPSTLALYRIAVAETPRFPKIGEVVYATGPMANNREVASFLAEAARNGEIQVGDADTAAQQFVGMVLLDILQRCLFGIEAPPKAGRMRKIVDAAVETFLRAHTATD
ncbi:MAG: TetR/AcrR family transcriptional regulator [Ferrovibrio sp.]|uniref:TetR/AcrR family transcriptional regulator n=1 Tax=Ferrovibrio sp. TaxID=1917215 RepID=UPI00391C5448